MLEVTPDAIERARLRIELGNPPGKRGSLGDAVNWELLLNDQPDDLLFYVTNDKDFYSHLDSAEPHEFLVAEWSEKVGGLIAFRKRLSELPEESVPQDVLPVDDAPPDRGTELAERLVESGSFAETHAVIAALRQYQQFTPRQVHIVVSALENSQVSWIASDEDVFSFYSWLLQTHEPVMTAEDSVCLRKVLDDAEEVRAEWSDPPF